MNAAAVQEQIRRARRERLWAWASLLVLIVAWDVASRLDQRASLPRLRIAHAVELERVAQRLESEP